ncbi:hypothetical protein [Streptomyces sp. NPDC092952]|uniref:hypothetical protein n=1 Tax=Streptomyces sp. NPDC092952 TaxID=3366018 RepID=UPI0037F36881
MRYPVGPALEKALRLTALNKRLKGDSSETVRDLFVRYSDSLVGLRNFPDIEVLILAGCDPVSFDEFSNLSLLASLRVHDSGLSGITGVENFSDLDFLSIQRNTVQDLRPLLGNRIARIEIEGNPLSEHSYYEVIPKLVEQGSEVSYSGEREWRITLRMQSAGIPLVCYSSEDLYYLCCPGFSMTKTPDYDHPEVRVGEVEEILDRDPRDLIRLFEKRGGTGIPPES